MLYECDPVYAPTTINVIAGSILENGGVGDIVVDELAEAHHQQGAPLVWVVQISVWELNSVFGQ